MISIYDEDFNDRCEALLDRLFLAYHSYHYTVGKIEIQFFNDRKLARQHRREVLEKELKLKFRDGMK